MKRTFCAAVCLAMLLASCGGGMSQDAKDAIERFENFTVGKGFKLDPRPSPDEDEPEDEASATEPDAEAVGRAVVARDRIARQAADVRRLVGGSPPVETAAAQDRRARQLAPRSDSRLDTATYFDGHTAELLDYSTSVRCSGSRCVHTHPDGETQTFDLSSPTFVVGTTLLTRNGITIETYNDASVDDTGRSAHWASIGATLHDSAFFSGYSYKLENADYYGDTVKGGSAYGDLTGSGPSFSGTWRGMATAVTKQNDDLLLGDAELRYSFSASGGSLSATLGSFVSVTDARATTPLGIFFEDVQVDSDGTFASGYLGRNIRGAFYGNAHAEATGVFEGTIPDGLGDSLDLLGAFGTKRQGQ